MPLNIRNDHVNRLAETLARRTRVTKTEAIKAALENELRRLDEALPLRERLKLLQKRVNARPATGLEADKGFYDDINGFGVIVLDASAIVAILTDEDEAATFIEAMKAISERVTAPIAISRRP